MKIAMVGSGYVGLVSGACFADFGHDVVCIDKDPAKIDSLKAGIMPIYEPGLAELVGSNVKAGRLSFTTDLAEGIAGASAIFIAVGTPSRRGDGHADLSFVYAVAAEVGANLRQEAVIITKSTVPVGTGDEVERILTEANPGVRAPDLAASLGRETKPFKLDVRKLKELGLTHSLPVGYELSPRGRAFLDAEPPAG